MVMDRDGDGTAKSRLSTSGLPNTTLRDQFAPRCLLARDSIPQTRGLHRVRYPGQNSGVTGRGVIPWDMIAAWRVREDRAGGANRHQPRHGDLGVRVQEFCGSRGGRPGLSDPNEPYGFCGRKATLNRA